jgi:4-hydroxy-4-methyl-2-oxoglutarate aldolase
MTSLHTERRTGPDDVWGAEGTPSDDEVAELAALGTSTVHEGVGRECVLSPRLHPVWSGARMAGPAFTVRPAVGDGLGVHRAVRMAPPGSVLVVDGEGLDYGYFGELLAHIAVVRGIAGVLVDGSVSDVDALKDLAFPVFAGGVSPRRASKRSESMIGERVTVGGRSISPGDVVVADSDGVVVVPRDGVRAAIRCGRLHSEAEREQIAAIRRGIIPPVTLDLDR